MLEYNINGWIFVDKPEGISSNNLLQKVRKLFLNCKAGYVGTLDPLATGFLPLALGKATKTIKYLSSKSKEYVFTVTWGQKTSTGDLEGQVIEEQKIFPKEENIKLELKNLIGNINQVPPKFSAIKIDGKRAYKLARDKKEFELPVREVKIYNLKILKTIDKKNTQFYLKCSSGTYVRTLAEDLSKLLGTVCHLSSLRRIGFGDLDKKLISLDYLFSLMHIDKLIKVLKPVDYVFRDKILIKIKLDEAKLLIDGKFLKVSANNDFLKIKDKNFVIVKYEDKLVVIGRIENDKFYPKDVINLNNL